MFGKSNLTEEEIKKIVDDFENMTWEDMIENTTVHFWELDPTKFKHREENEIEK